MADKAIIKDGTLPKKKELTRKAMIEYIANFGDEADCDWWEALYEDESLKIEKVNTLGKKDENGNYPIEKKTDVSKVRVKFLERFFAEELKANKDKKKNDSKKSDIELAREKIRKRKEQQN